MRREKRGAAERLVGKEPLSGQGHFPEAAVGFGSFTLLPGLRARHGGLAGIPSRTVKARAYGVSGTHAVGAFDYQLK